ncbi:MAG: alpha/beta family hydrolase [Bryobacteraceae bacterium]
MKRFEREMVRGWLHEPEGPLGKGIVLAHGAGSNCESPLLKSTAEAFASSGFHVLRCDLPYRQQRPHGPPTPALASRDREGLQRAGEAMREIIPFVILGGHSYGGRQSSMLLAEQSGVADMLLLLSYPLHPPKKREQLRTAHFPVLHTPALFVHGTRDPFGLIPEMEAAITAIPGRHRLVGIEKAGHELGVAAVPVILEETQCFVNELTR